MTGDTHGELSTGGERVPRKWVTEIDRAGAVAFRMPLRASVAAAADGAERASLAVTGHAHSSIDRDVGHEQAAYRLAEAAGRESPEDHRQGRELRGHHRER